MLANVYIFLNTLTGYAILGHFLIEFWKLLLMNNLSFVKYLLGSCCSCFQMCFSFNCYYFLFYFVLFCFFFFLRTGTIIVYLTPYNTSNCLWCRIVGNVMWAFICMLCPHFSVKKIAKRVQIISNFLQVHSQILRGSIWMHFVHRT